MDYRATQAAGERAARLCEASRELLETADFLIRESDRLTPPLH